MDVLLIPGFWLDARSWDPVAPALRAIGTNPVALTMPGVGGDAHSTAAIGIGEWVADVVAEIDRREEPVVLVGHSGGGNVAWGATDARPDRVSRVVFVDTIPPHPGAAVSEFPVQGGVVPFPGWDFFDTDDTHDLDDDTRARTLPLTASIPARVPTDQLPLHDQRRFDVPVTLLMGGMDDNSFRTAVREWGAFGEEFAAIRSTEVRRLDTAHWPQFSQPERLATALAEVIARG